MASMRITIVVTPFGCLHHVEHMLPPLYATSLLFTFFWSTLLCTSGLAIFRAVQNGKLMEALQAS